MTATYYLRPGIGLRVNAKGQVYVTLGHRLFQVDINLPEEQLTHIVDLLCDGATVGSLAAATTLPADDCEAVLDSFVANKWATKSNPHTTQAMTQRLANYFDEGTDAAGYERNLANTSVLVVGNGSLDSLLLDQLVKIKFNKILKVGKANPQHSQCTSVASWEQGLSQLAADTKSLGFVISCGDFWGGDWERSLSRAVKASPKIHALRLTMEGETGVVGPIINKDSAACWECYQCHREDIYSDTLRFAASLRPLSEKVQTNSHKACPVNPPGAEEAIVAIALGEIIGFASGTMPARLLDRVHYFNFTNLKGRQTDLIPSPRCPACGEKEFTLTRRVWDEVQI